MCRVTMGHLRVTVGHPRVTIGRFRMVNNGIFEKRFFWYFFITNVFVMVHFIIKVPLESNFDL